MGAALGLGVFLKAWGAFSGSSDAQVTQDDLAPVLADIKTGFEAIDDVFKHADRQAKEAVSSGVDSGTAIAKVAQDLNDITGHTYRTVIPHSLSWLAGYVLETWIKPIRKELSTLTHDIKFLMGWRGQIDSWRKHDVDPALAAWRGWRKWFNGWPRGVLFRWHDYFQHPAHFASWAAPLLVSPIVSWLSTPEHKQERDVLSLMMVTAWQERPNATWEAILQWVVTES